MRFINRVKLAVSQTTNIGLPTESNTSYQTITNVRLTL